MDDAPRRSRRPADDDEPLRRRPSRGEDEERPRRRPSPRNEDEDDRPRRRREEEREEERPRRPRMARDEDEGEEERSRPRRRERRSPSNQGMGVQTKILLGVGVAALVFLGLAVAGVVLVVRSVKRGPFRPHMATYLAAPTGNAPAGTPIKKVVVVDVKDKDVDGLHFDLPDTLRAGTPEEATTVVWVSWDKRQVGAYTTGGNAYQWFCDVTVIDLATKARIAGQNFSGSPPPATFRGRRGESRTGDKPTDAVLNYIKGLPRR